jgi:hypothetical protein
MVGWVSFPIRLRPIRPLRRRVCYRRGETPLRCDPRRRALDRGPWSQLREALWEVPLRNPLIEARRTNSKGFGTTSRVANLRGRLLTAALISLRSSHTLNVEVPERNISTSSGLNPRYPVQDSAGVPMVESRCGGVAIIVFATRP